MLDISKIRTMTKTLYFVLQSPRDHREFGANDYIIVKLPAVYSVHRVVVERRPIDWRVFTMRRVRASYTEIRWMNTEDSGS